MVYGKVYQGSVQGGYTRVVYREAIPGCYCLSGWYIPGGYCLSGWYIPGWCRRGVHGGVYMEGCT